MQHVYDLRVVKLVIFSPREPVLPPELENIVAVFREITDGEVCGGGESPMSRKLLETALNVCSVISSRQNEVTTACIPPINLNPSHLTLLYFSSPITPQCQQMREILVELSSDPVMYNRAIVEIPSEKLLSLSLKYKIRVVPTIIFTTTKGHLRGTFPQIFRGGVRLCSLEGEGLRDQLRKALVLSIDERLELLVGRAKVMLFMKGTPDVPRCGFSRKTVELIDFDYFDILSDEEVRQELKRYSNWMTYPQLYVQSKLVGGLDVIQAHAVNKGFGPKESRKNTRNFTEQQLKEAENTPGLMSGHYNTPCTPQTHKRRDIGTYTQKPGNN
ncbi:glutaredoxin-3-like [Octopus sinensis]|uniref:Glutaredoxin-3-like n=1 Tax=Octopus sinensis TaxID=2607531 RepID=A0A6P7TRI1_9MOLL|nr:glutaredoxin-3-like [Octopus sinensis]